MSELSGLSKAQLAFKMTPESWSIAEVVEHLAIAEPQYWQKLQDSMKQPPTTDTMDATDAGIMWYGIDRTNRARTGEARVPHGRFADVRESLASFRKLRTSMIEYEKTTKEELRTRKLLEGNMDVSVVPDDLVALAAPHPAAPRDQGSPSLSLGVVPLSY